MVSDTAWIDSAEIIIVECNTGNNDHHHHHDRPGAAAVTWSGTATAASSSLIASVSTIVLKFSQQEQPFQNYTSCVLLNVMSTTTVALPEEKLERCDLEITNNTIGNSSQPIDQNFSLKKRQKNIIIVRLHPLLYEYMTILSQSDTFSQIQKGTEPNIYPFNFDVPQTTHPLQQPITIAPLPMPGYQLPGVVASDDCNVTTTTSNCIRGKSCDNLTSVISSTSCWYMESITPSSNDMVYMTEILPPDSIIHIQIIYMYDIFRHEIVCDEAVGDRKQQQQFEWDENRQKHSIVLALQGRIITIGAVLLLPIIRSSSNGQLHGIRYYYLVRIENVIIPSSFSSASRDESDTTTTLTISDRNHPHSPPSPILYRMDVLNSINSNKYTVHISHSADELHDDSIVNDNDERNSGVSNDTDTEHLTDNVCPGYNRLQSELLQFLQIPMVSVPPPSIVAEKQRSMAVPSGILITGCAGVGKTKLISSIGTQMDRLFHSSSMYHYISVHNLIMLASWADENAIMDAVEPPRLDCMLLVLDDLHILGSSDINDSNTLNNRECRLVLNSIIQVFDRINNTPTSSSRSCTIVGLARDKSHIPSELLKVGRFEKDLNMLPPSQSQREVILFSLLIGLKEYATSEARDEYTVRSREWADVLASATAGCVASDLRRLCSDAWSNSLARFEMDTTEIQRKALPNSDPLQMKWPVTWYDLSEAVRNITPSQLAMLDVTKPRRCLDLGAINDWPGRHKMSWEPLAGYESVKKRVYRAVVVPWLRQLNRRSDFTTDVGTIIPPSGILFHGPSGCGKTIAASCLGSSLGLPMIKVRAADVLDKWLGGSEATMRSLFARARSAAPCILFFDEIDAVASNRANSDGVTADVMSRLLSTLLNEMDGVSSTHQSNVIVVACTNRLENLDAALLRPGRLEEHVMLALPSQDDTYAILQQKTARAPIDESIDLTLIAEDLTKRRASGADIDGICREAIYRAIRRCSLDDFKISVNVNDIENAVTAIKL